MDDQHLEEIHKEIFDRLKALEDAKHDHEKPSAKKDEKKDDEKKG